MIQRIQSLFLFMAALMCLLMLFFPLVEFTNTTASFIFDSYGIREAGGPAMDINVLPLPVFNVLAIIMLFISIFFYRNRKKQVVLVNLSMLLITGVVAAIFFYAGEAEEIIGTEGLKTSYKAATLFPVIALILAFMANRAIRKDEALVRSADRIR